MGSDQYSGELERFVAENTWPCLFLVAAVVIGARFALIALIEWIVARRHRRGRGGKS